MAIGSQTRTLCFVQPISNCNNRNHNSHNVSGPVLVLASVICLATVTWVPIVDVDVDKESVSHVASLTCPAPAYSHEHSCGCGAAERFAASLAAPRLGPEQWTRTVSLPRRRGGFERARRRRLRCAASRLPGLPRKQLTSVFVKQSCTVSLCFPAHNHAGPATKRHPAGP